MRVAERKRYLKRKQERTLLAELREAVHQADAVFRTAEKLLQSK